MFKAMPKQLIIIYIRNLFCFSLNNDHYCVLKTDKEISETVLLANTFPEMAADLTSHLWLQNTLILALVRVLLRTTTG